MRNKIFTLFASLLMAGGLMAEPLSPVVDYSYRLNWGTNTYNFNIKQNSNPTPGEGQIGYSATYEIKWKSQYFALQQYNVPNIEYVKSMTLSIPHFDSSIDNFTTNMSVWNFNANSIPTNSSNKSNLLLAVQATTGTALYDDRAIDEEPDSEHHAEPTATSWGSTTKRLATTTYNDHIWTATIGREVLTDISKDGTTGRVRFLMTPNNPNAGTAAKYAAGSTLAVVYYAVYNETTHTGYDDLASAVSAANDNDVLTIVQDLTLTDRLDITKVLTLHGNNKTITINKFSKSGILIKAGFILDNCTVTPSNTGYATFELTGTSNFTASFTNVTVSNANVGTNGVYRIKDKASVTLTNVVNEDITVTEGYGEIFVAQNAQSPCNLRGTVSVASAYLEKDKRLNVNGATISTPIQLSFISTYQDPYVCIQKSQDLTKFSVYDDSKELFVSKTTDGGEISVRTIPDALSYNLTVTDAGMATLVLGFDAELPSGVKAYTLSNNGDADIWAQEVSQITKNQPVLVVADANTYTFTSAAGVALDEQANPSYGCLKGTYEDKIDVPACTDGVYNYILANGASGPGFYKVPDGTCKIKCNHAYLSCGYDAPVSSGDSAPMRIRFDKQEEQVATDFEQVQDNTLQPVKVQKLIINGELFIQRDEHLYRIDGRMVK